MRGKARSEMEPREGVQQALQVVFICLGEQHWGVASSFMQCMAACAVFMYTCVCAVFLYTCVQVQLAAQAQVAAWIDSVL